MPIANGNTCIAFFDNYYQPMVYTSDPFKPNLLSPANYKPKDGASPNFLPNFVSLYISFIKCHILGQQLNFSILVI